MGDVSDQLEQQQMLIEQLKNMIRDRDAALTNSNAQQEVK
jgi:hypothetical protein